MRIITNKELAAAVRKAHAENRLIATTTKLDGMRRSCVYQHPQRKECGCAIGVALLSDELAAIQRANKNKSGVQAIAKLVVEFENVSKAVQLQAYHDDACSTAYSESRIARFWNVVEELEKTP